MVWLYLPMYKSISHFGAKNKFLLFVGKNYYFLEKPIPFFQVCYCDTKNLSWTFLDLSSWPIYKSNAIFFTDF